MPTCPLPPDSACLTVPLGTTPTSHLAILNPAPAEPRTPTSPPPTNALRITQCDTTNATSPTTPHDLMIPTSHMRTPIPKTCPETHPENFTHESGPATFVDPAASPSAGETPAPLPLRNLSSF
ncbi:MAG: hypothetical protein LBK99_04395 [Opitutaceae bacterium]|nr:hypothetical protein [Opitutaceae bacterium]